VERYFFGGFDGEYKLVFKLSFLVPGEEDFSSSES